MTRNFIVDRTAGALELLRQDGITGPRAWAKLLWYACGSAGHDAQDLRAPGRPISCPASIPGTIDDRALIADYEAESGAGIDSAKKVRRAA